MKNAILTLLIGLTFIGPALAQAPKVQGQGSSSGVYSPNILVPNQTATKINGTTSLLETGNNNLLANPSFEAPLPSSSSIPGWTNEGTVVFTQSSTAAFNGSKYVSGLVVSGALNVYQDSTLNAVAFANGVNGTRSIALRTATAYTSTMAIYVCARKAGVLIATSNGTEITDCLLVENNDTWKDYAFASSQLGATSNGIAVVSLNPTTGAVVDAVGALVFFDKAEVSQTNRALNIGICDSVECTTEFSAFVDLAGVVYHENMDWIIGNASVSDTSLFSVTQSPLIADQMNCEVNVMDASVSVNNSAKMVQVVGGVLQVRTGHNTTASNFVKAAAPFFIMCQRKGADYTAAIAKRNKSFLTDSASSFSTDVNPLYFKATAITDSDPVGTFNTYSYAANTNTKTICGTAPTQTIADMKVNGIQIFTRAYNAASTCAAPARVEVKLGKGMQDIQKILYKDTSKNVSGSLDFGSPSLGVEYGTNYKNYNDSSGVQVIDTGVSETSTTVRVFVFNDVSAQNNGYLVINAQKAKDTMVAEIADMAKSEGSGGVDIQSVYFGSGANCYSACTTGSCTICRKNGSKITSVTWETTGVYRINGIDGLSKYTCNGSALGGDSPAGLVQDLGNSTVSYARILSKAGAAFANSSYADVTCIGTK